MTPHRAPSLAGYVAAVQWADFPWGVALTLGTLLVAVVMLAMDERNRRKFAARELVLRSDGTPKFASREDLNGMGERIEKEMAGLRRDCERTSGLFVQLDDRVGVLEGFATRMEERQAQQWERISEQMAGTARTIDTVTKELRDIADMQHDLALQLERAHHRIDPPTKPSA